MNEQARIPKRQKVAMPSLASRALVYIRSRWVLITAISVLIVVPCYWHRRIAAGDLASHTYNAWLAQLIGQDHAPGLYVVQQWNNVVVDLALLHLGNSVGFIVAERIVSAACVLVFFWGAFAFVSAATLRIQWFLVPAIAMISYGYTFYMGFMNFYLSLGLGFFAAALFWRGTRADWIGGLVLSILTLMAHPLGFACLVGTVGYISVAEKTRGFYRWGVFISAFLVLYGLNVFIHAHYRNAGRFSHTFYFMNGADQLVLFGARYISLTCIVFISISLCVGLALIPGGNPSPPVRTFRTPSELWMLMIFAAAMIPEFIWLPRYGDNSSFGFVVSRLTTMTAIFGICVLGSTQLGKGHVVGLSAMAVAFFIFQYEDTGALNRMEQQAEQLIRLLPYGRRVLDTTCTGDSRIPGHLVDAACLEKCFSYSNYEAATHQFRVRALPGNTIVSISADANRQMGEGQYIVRKEDLPISQIYSCDAADLNKLCIRDLTAGEKNGPINCMPELTDSQK